MSCFCSKASKSSLRSCHSLARDVAYGQLGMLSDRNFANQLNRATGLSLLLNVIAVVCIA